ncbi:WXG100 family type VII secretion target, partial [Kibdelosporangium philippinense]
MGIELPSELADVAARTGVKWPAADEDKMREVAQAWRDTGQKITTLISEADTTARAALSTTEGASADAARRHWGTFVQPDTGHLTRIAKGCMANADKLDHAANQISQAKLAIVRELTPLAKNINVAEGAAQAGDHTALLGLDTAIKGVAANIANVQSTLVTAVRPAAGVAMETVEPVVGGHRQNVLAPVANLAAGAAYPGGYGPGVLPAAIDAVTGMANPGGHGSGVLPAVTDAVSGVASPAAGVVPGVANPVVDAVAGVANPGGHGPGALPPVMDPGGHGPGGPSTNPGQLPPMTGQPVLPPGQHGPGDFGPGTGHSGLGAGGPMPPPGTPTPMEPVTGPLPIGGSDAPTPAVGIPRPDHVQLAGASAVLDAPAPQQAPAQQAPAIAAQPAPNQP